jgi:hypothetical protein
MSLESTTRFLVPSLVERNQDHKQAIRLVSVVGATRISSVGGDVEACTSIRGSTYTGVGSDGNVRAVPSTLPSDIGAGGR